MTTRYYPDNVEVWKDIKDYVGMYQISSFGRVKNVSKKFWTGSTWCDCPERLRALSNDKDGYCFVGLSKDKISKPKKVHQLVLEAFDRSKGKNEVTRHLDGNRGNNKINNLCWGTMKENASDRRKHGTQAVGQRSKCSKLKDGEVLLMRKILKNCVVSQAFIAKMFKISQTEVWRIKHGHRWSYI